jgi:hypothetical protein
MLMLAIEKNTAVALVQFYVFSQHQLHFCVYRFAFVYFILQLCLFMSYAVVVGIAANIVSGLLACNCCQLRLLLFVVIIPFFALFL